MSCENISSTSRRYKYQYNLDNSDIKWRDMFISYRMHMLHRDMFTNVLHEKERASTCHVQAFVIVIS